MAFRVALSGLNAASSELNVIGNNIANASTTGFKQSRAQFADIYAASNLGVTSNAIGSGVKIASVKQEFSQGNVTFTNNNLDLAISGNGFFRLNDNGVNVFTRAGAFGVDRDGYVVNDKNQKLTGYGADSAGNITGALSDLQLSTADLSPQETGTATMQANLDSTQPNLTSASFDQTDPATYTNSTTFTAYDSLGNPRQVTNYFVKTGSASWDMYMTVDGTLVQADGGKALSTPPVTTDYARTLNFTSSGALDTTSSPATVATGTIPASGGSAPFTIDMNLGSTTQYGSSFAVNSLTQDGYGTGRLSGVDISNTGIMTARYTNGQSKTLAQVALANFPDPQGLRQLGDTTWGETYDSGSALVGKPGSSSLGLVQSGALEASNVDLTEQLVSMITAQRDFQANAQVVQTSSAITQTIIGLR
jgi:flagellar hook protein FlgE